MMCIPVPTFSVYSVLIWRIWVTFLLGLDIIHTVSQTPQRKIPKAIKLICPYIKPKCLFMSNQSVETTYKSRFRFSPWIEFVLGIMSIMCCLSFSMLPFLSAASGRSLVALTCSVYFCDDTFICHRCTVREWTPMSPGESDNFLSPFPFTLANSVSLSCLLQVILKVYILKVYILPYTGNNPTILLMLYNSAKQSAKQGCEQYLNLPPE